MNEILNNEDNNLLVIYKKKKINFYKIKTKDKKKIIKIWEDTRNQYLKVLNKLKTKKINNKFIPDFFNWEDTSSWWFSLVELKDTELDNCWFKKLFLINFFIYYKKKNIIVISDDAQINKILNSQFKNIMLKEESSFKINNFILNFTGLLKTIYTDLRNLFIFKLLNVHIKNKKKAICELWIVSLFPANWVLFDKNDGNDRFFINFFDKASKIKKNYLLLFEKYQKNKTNIFQDIILIRNKIKKNFVFLNYYISTVDIINIYISTLKEYFNFLSLKKNSSFLKNINIKGIDVSEIFLNELEKSFFGFIQNAKYHGLAMKNFLLDKSDKQNFITYGELIANIRPLYFFVKQHSIKNKIITFQHATHYKNKMIINHNKADFSTSKRFPSIYNLIPDLYMVHGEQFKKILSKYYPGKIAITGSLKYHNIINKIRSKNKIRNEIRKKLKINKNDKIILLAPSTHDIDNIFKILINFKYSQNFTMILSPHPSVDLNRLKKYQNTNYSNLDIKYVNNFETIDLVCASDLIVSSASSIAVEALLFNKKSVRFMDLGNVPKFDYEKNIPTFFSSADFNHWIVKSFKKKNFKNNKNIISKYFNKIDNQINIRFEKSIKKTIKS